MNQPSLFEWAGGSAKLPRKKSQTAIIGEYLMAGGTITPLEALEKWGCFRLAARIHDLRKAGMNIVEEDVNYEGVTFARYFMEARA